MKRPQKPEAKPPDLKDVKVLDKVLGWVRDDLAAPLTPFAQGGLKDLQNFFAHAFPDSRQQADVLGMVGSPTPKMVDEALKPDAAKGNDADVRKSVLGFDIPAPVTPQVNENEKGMER